MRNRARTDKNPPQHQTLAIAHGTTAVSLLVLLGAIAGGIVTGDTPLLLLAPALLPLLIFVPTVWRADPRGLAALCFVCLLYFTVIMTRLFAPDTSGFDVAAMVAVVILFLAAMLCSRWRRARLDIR